MFIDFDTGSLKVYVLRGTKTCAGRRGYDRRHVTLVACVRADGFYVRPALLWPSALTRGDLVQHEACPMSVKATKRGWSSEDIFIEWLREFCNKLVPKGGRATSSLSKLPAREESPKSPTPSRA